MTVTATFHGVRIDHHVGHFARALLEGVTFAQKEVLDAFLEGGANLKQICASGGGASNPLWMQMKADVLKIPHTTLRIKEAASFGAALLAAYHMGMITMPPEPKQSSYWTPHPELSDVYSETYKHWSKLKDYMFAFNERERI